jgi:hypothetical protein
MDWVLYVLAAPVVLVVLYIAARFIFVAYFKSRDDFEKRNKQR